MHCTLQSEPSTAQSVDCKDETVDDRVGRGSHWQMAEVNPERLIEAEVEIFLVYSKLEVGRGMGESGSGVKTTNSVLLMTS